MPGQDPDVLLERVQKSADENGLELDVRIKGNPLRVDPDSQFVQEVVKLAGRDKPRTVAYGTDGAMLGALKNLIVFGPGSIAQAHTHDEFIDLDQLEKGTEMYSKLIRHWCC